MYHFVKFNNTWYLKPESVQDIIDHFKKICGREFKEGFEDYKDNVVVKKDHNGEPYLYSMNHSSSVWRNAVELCEMKLKGLTWLEGATSLEFIFEMVFLIIVVMYIQLMMKRFGKKLLNTLMNTSMMIADLFSGLKEDIGMQNVETLILLIGMEDKNGVINHMPKRQLKPGVDVEVIGMNINQMKYIRLLKDGLKAWDIL